MDLKNYIPLTDKYLPKTFDECSHAHKTNKILKSFTDFKQGIPNIILYGYNGSGKYLRLLLLLNNYLGHLSNPLNTSVKAIDTVTGSFVPLPTHKNKEKNKVIFVTVSKVHCEIELSQSGIEKVLVKFLNYYSKNKNILLGIHKYIILKNFEYLKRETQNSLRFIVEKSFKSVKFLVTTNSLSKIISPLRSRFISLHVKSPDEKEAFIIVNNIIKNEKYSLTNNRINKLIESSKEKYNLINLNELILSLEGSVLCKNFKTEKQEILDILLKTVKKGNRDDIRNLLFKIYEITPNNFNNLITIDFFIKINELIKDKMKLIEITQQWNYEINKNHILNPIFHAEAYLLSLCELLNI